MKKYLLFSALCCLLFIFSARAQNTIYVNASATGANNGSSWPDAYTDFQTGVNAASTGDSVFVAGGIYQPASGQSFSMKEGVKIYGGFAGTEANFSDRDLSAGDTSILKGNGSSVIYNDNNGLTATAILDGFTITEGNVLIGGGGMYNSYSSPTISNCIFFGNICHNLGGGIFNGHSSPSISSCIFSGNHAFDGGGGIDNEFSFPILTNCIFSGNEASDGGGMLNYQSSPVLINCTFSGNSATTWGGVHNVGSSLTLTNCIIYGNSGLNQIVNDGSSSTVNYSLVQNWLGGGTGNLSTDPGFINAPDYTSAPFTSGDYHLQSGSPAVNAGTPDTTGLHLPQTDLGGSGRISGGRIDMGAYEYLHTLVVPDANGILYVNSVSAGGLGDSWDRALNSFSQALQAARSNTDVKQIWVAKGTYQPDAGQSFSMVPNVKIYGGFAGTETNLSERNLSADDTSILKGNGSSVILNNNNGLDTSAMLNGFKITGGNASVNYSLFGYVGGGIFNLNASPSIINCTISGNQASNGGGIFNANASPFIIKCTISENQASSGGGIFNVNLNANVSSPFIINCIISGNQVTNGGGGIYSYSGSSILINCSFIGNNASAGQGGGIYIFNQGPLILSNCILWNNSDGIKGPSSAIITYSLVQGMAANLTNHNLDGSTNPMFVNTVNGNYQLQPGSPAINVGVNDSIPDWDSTDLNGNSRIYDLANGGIVDMGAYEYQAAPDSTIITNQPENIIACSSKDTALHISAIGANLHYQWQSSTDGGEAWVNETNGTSETLELANVQTSDNGTQYRVIVTGDWNIDTSNVVTLTAFAAPVISSQPQPQSVSEGTSATFTVTATGMNLQYQWQLYVRNGWNNITNATVFTIPSVSKKDAGIYRVIITGSCGEIISQQAALTVATKPGNPKPIPPGHLPPGCTPNISMQPTAQSVCIGTNATFNVTASDATGYQWQYATGNGKKAWTNIANATGSTFILPSVSGSDNGKQYQVIVSSNCGSVTSKSATLTVERVDIEKEPQDVYVYLDKGPKGKQNNKMVKATFNVQAAGTGDISYQWQLSTDRSATWNDISGATQSSLTITNITINDDSLQYRAIVTGDCNSVTSDVATLKVNEDQVKDGPSKGNKVPPGKGNNAEKIIQQEYQVYPNPVTQSSLTIEDKLGNPLNEINLYDISGHLVLTTQTQNTTISLQLPQLADGNYILQIIDNNHLAYSIEIVVQATGQPLK